MLQDKTAILRLEIDTVKYHNQEMEKIFWEHCNCKKKRKEIKQASKQERKKEREKEWSSSKDNKTKWGNINKNISI